MLDGADEVGSIAPERVFTRRATVELPCDMPAAVKMFIVWLVIIMWKRDADAGSD